MFKTIIATGMLVGTLDIIAAIIHTLIRGGNPIKMLQFIASGIFGSKAFLGGTPFAVYGLAVHYSIAIVWTLIFFKLFARMTFFSRNKIVTGIGYGLFVWVIMTFIVLPLSNTPPLPFSMQSAAIGAIILIFAVGLPLSFSANRYYSHHGFRV